MVVPGEQEEENLRNNQRQINKEKGRKEGVTSKQIALLMLRSSSVSTQTTLQILQPRINN